MLPPTSCMPRLRNAAATRQAMLASARRHFARESYESVGLREIAGEAGVDPALVSRYFGSKEQLFREALRGEDSLSLDGVARDALPAYLASLFIDHGSKNADQTATKVDCLLMMLRSASSPKASEIVREALSEDVLEPMAGLLAGDDAPVRASLSLAVLMGCGILRSTMAIDPLCQANESRLRDRLTALFAAALAEAPNG
ncbi:MAG: TetR family transcriptional regulator [Pseudomonadota bacterium]